MNLVVLTGLAEIVASLAVVITLVYLTHEFRNNLKKSRIDNLSKAIESQARQFAHLTDDEEKAALLRRALVDFEGLTQGEKGLVHTVFFDICISQNIIRRAHGMGMLDEDEFRALQNNWLSLMRTDGARRWYSVWKHSTPRDWQKYVDSVLDDPALEVKPLYHDMPWLYALQNAKSGN